MRLAFVRPAVPGAEIPVPGTRSRLAATGRTVDVETRWWAERLADGSVVEAVPPPSTNHED